MSVPRSGSGGGGGGEGRCGEGGGGGGCGDRRVGGVGVNEAGGVGPDVVSSEPLSQIPKPSALASSSCSTSAAMANILKTTLVKHLKTAAEGYEGVKVELPSSDRVYPDIAFEGPALGGKVVAATSRRRVGRKPRGHAPRLRPSLGSRFTLATPTSGTPIIIHRTYSGPSTTTLCTLRS
jgi:hypothetical protein